MSTPPASTTPPTITVSRRVHVTCVEESSGNQLKSFKLDVEVPQTVATLAAVQELNKKLWPTVKNCIPKRLFNGQYIRTRYNISVYHSNRTEQFIRNLNVSFRFVESSRTTTSTSSSSLMDVPDEVFMGRLAPMMEARSIVRCAFTCTRYRRVLLKSSVVVVSALSHAMSECRDFLEKFNVADAQQALVCSLSSLTLVSDSEVRALEGALSSWMPCSSSLSPGFIQAWSFIMSVYILTKEEVFAENMKKERQSRSRSRGSFSSIHFGGGGGGGGGEDGSARTASRSWRALKQLESVHQGRTKKLIDILQKNSGATFVGGLHVSPWPLDQHFNVTSLSTSFLHTSSSSSSSSSSPPILTPLMIPEILYSLSIDPTIKCVDSVPLQHLASRFLNVCRASLDVVIQTIPYTITMERLKELEIAERSLLTRYQQRNNVEGINSLNDFEKRRWPDFESKLSLHVFAALDRGKHHRHALMLAKACGIIK